MHDSTQEPTITVVEKWYGNRMIKYILNRDGSTTVLERGTRDCPYTLGKFASYTNWSDVRVETEPETVTGMFPE